MFYSQGGFTPCLWEWCFYSQVMVYTMNVWELFYFYVMRQSKVCTRRTNRTDCHFVRYFISKLGFTPWTEQELMVQLTFTVMMKRSKRTVPFQSRHWERSIVVLITTETEKRLLLAHAGLQKNTRRKISVTCSPRYYLVFWGRNCWTDSCIEWENISWCFIPE